MIRGTVLGGPTDKMERMSRYMLCHFYDMIDEWKVCFEVGAARSQGRIEGEQPGRRATQ